MAKQEAPGAVTDPDQLAAEEKLEELRRQLVATPVEVVVANHAYGLFELAAIHLSEKPPNLDQARLATDALGALVEGVGARLGEAGGSLQEALSQIRLAYVQISGARSTGNGSGDSSSGDASSGDASSGDASSGDSSSGDADPSP